MNKISLTLHPSWITMLIGLILCLIQYWLGNLPAPIQIVFFAVMLAITGIPHGAIDHLIEQETARRQHKVFRLLPFLIKYLGIMLLYAIVWFGYPLLGLASFLLISAWHFGETDLDEAPNTWLWNLTKLLSGTWVIWFILLSHPSETAPVWNRIAQEDAIAVWVWQTAAQHGNYLLSTGFVLTAMMFGLSNRAQRIPIDTMRYLHLGIILLLSYMLPLLPAFALYFSGWHAVYSFRSIGQHLVADHTYSGQSLSGIWLKSLPFTGIALVFLGIMAYLWQSYWQSWDPLPVLFIFLSLITLPHLNVMSNMHYAPQA